MQKAWHASSLHALLQRLAAGLGDSTEQRGEHAGQGCSGCEQN